MHSHVRWALLAAGWLTMAGALAGPLDALLGEGRQAIPAPEEVFRMRAVGGTQAHLELDIADGYYLYRDKLRVVAPGVGALIIQPPPGQAVQDPHFGTVAVLRGRVDVPAALPAAAARVEVEYQGCAEDRLCYAPARRTLTVDPA